VLTVAFLIVANAAALTPQAQSPPVPDQAPPPDRPITRLVQNLGEDLTRLPALDTLAILAAGGLAATVAGNSDHRVDRWTLDHPASSWTKIGRVGGDGATLAGAAIGTWALGALADQPLMTHVGSDLIRVQVLNGVLTTGLKVAVDRRRPSGGRHAFPSGHTSAAFASAGVLQQHFGWTVGAPALAASSFIAYTRVRDRVHWLSDVVFGAAVGLASARAVTRGHQSRSWSVTPVAVPGGVGVVFLKTGSRRP
jgi:membrane-associated phospholipid phosphatase